jgi:hypothetical protein
MYFDHRSYSPPHCLLPSPGFFRLHLSKQHLFCTLQTSRYCLDWQEVFEKLSILSLVITLNALLFWQAESFSNTSCLLFCSQFSLQTWLKSISNTNHSLNDVVPWNFLHLLVCHFKLSLTQSCRACTKNWQVLWQNIRWMPCSLVLNGVPISIWNFMSTVFTVHIPISTLVC